MTVKAYRKELRRIAGILKEELPEKKGFILLTFDFFDNDGNCEYISNANRDDAIESMIEFIQRNRGEGYGKRIPL